jgi:hypothetical protein
MWRYLAVAAGSFSGSFTWIPEAPLQIGVHQGEMHPMLSHIRELM